MAHDPSILIDGTFTEGYLNPKQQRIKNIRPFDGTYSDDYFNAGGRIKACGTRPLIIAPRFQPLFIKKNKKKYDDESKSYNDCVEANRNARAGNSPADIAQRAADKAAQDAAAAADKIAVAKADADAAAAQTKAAADKVVSDKAAADAAAADKAASIAGASVEGIAGGGTGAATPPISLTTPMKIGLGVGAVVVIGVVLMIAFR